MYLQVFLNLQSIHQLLSQVKTMKPMREQF